MIKDHALRRNRQGLRAAIVAATVLFSSCTTDGNEVTAYPLLCASALAANRCKKVELVLNRERFKIFASTQQVVYWTPGVSETPANLEQCSVRDANNWACSYPRGQGRVGFRDGEFWSILIPPSLFAERLFYASSWRWWYERARTHWH